MVISDYNSHSNQVIYLSSYEDYYVNYAGYVTIYAYGGNDNIRNSYWDYLAPYNRNVVIYGGDGDDSLEGSDSGNDYIDGGAGNDYIRTYRDNTTIYGSTGDDVISKYGGEHNLIYYYLGDGYDTIYYLQENDTISLNGGYYTRTTVVSNVLVSMVSGGSMDLIGASGKTINIVGGTLSLPSDFTDGNDYYSNSASNTVLNALAGNDSIYNSASCVTINGDAGADTISGSAWSSKLNGGAGNDVINISQGDVDGATINGGTGNDIIYMDNYDGLNWIQYSQGDGYDTIYNFSSYDTISLGGGYYTRTTVGSNVLVSMLSGGSMDLIGASGKTIRACSH